MWHTRHRAAVELKLSEVPCIYADDLNDEQIMGGRGASLGVSVKGKKYGSEYRTILKNGYNHNENDGKKGASKLSLKEVKMVEKVNKIWYNYINKNRQQYRMEYMVMAKAPVRIRAPGEISDSIM